jgi:competence protein ComEA
VKQNIPIERSDAFISLAILLLALFPSACITQTQLTPVPASEGKVNAQASKTKRSELININTASSQELERLPGVGKIVAERIVAHREQYGPFRRPEHLMMVRGISDRKFREMRTLIVVE